MGTTTASVAGIEAQALADHIHDGALHDFTQGDDICSKLDWSWPDAGATVTRVELACWTAAKDMLALSMTGRSAEQGDARPPEEFDSVRERLAELVSAIEDVRYAEYSADGEGARFRDFAPIHRSFAGLERLIDAWETSLLGSTGQSEGRS